jgi:beta-mannosidase
MTCGPWKPIFLEVYDSRISDLSFNVQLSEDLTTAEIIVAAGVEGSAGIVRFTLSIAGRDIDTKVAQKR